MKGTFSQYLPDGLSEKDAKEVFTILGGSLEEMSGVGAVSGPSGGVGTHRRKKRTEQYVGRHRTPLGVPDIRYRDEDEKKDEMVSEVMNYLLGITVG